METCERKDGGWIEKCERKDAWGGEEGGEVWRGVLERRTTNKVFNEMCKTTPTGTHYPREIVQELPRPSAQPPARCSGYQSRNRSCC